MQMFFDVYIQPEMDKLAQLVRTDLAAIQATAEPTDEEVGF